LTKKVVITGASGFIGRALCERLEQMTDYLVIPVTRSHDREGFYTVNSYDETPLGDILVHLGEDPDRARVNNIGVTYQQETGEVVEKLIKQGYKKMIYCSSSVVYGDRGIEPYRENGETYPVDVYSKAKIENENRVLNSGGVVVRLSNVIGTGMAANNVLSDILNQLPNSSPLIVRNGKPIRDFVWLENAVQALVLLIRESVSGVFNVGTGVATSIHDLADMALKITGQGDRSINSMILDSDYSYNVINIEKMKRTLNWVPTVTLEHSIKNMADIL